jgi:hypothetical protein
MAHGDLQASDALDLEQSRPVTYHINTLCPRESGRRVYNVYNLATSHGKMNDVTVKTQQYLPMIAVAHGLMECRHGDETFED